MKNIILISLITGICFSSCDDEQLTKDQEFEHLQQLIAEIKLIASSVACDDPSLWKFASYGNKACGGPSGFIAYSTQVDTVLFLQKVKEYGIQQQNYNERWSIVSDCSTPAQPENVSCENGKPIFTYE